VVDEQTNSQAYALLVQIGNNQAQERPLLLLLPAVHALLLVLIVLLLPLNSRCWLAAAACL
jgi:hypothetical protein